MPVVSQKEPTATPKQGDEAQPEEGDQQRRALLKGIEAATNLLEAVRDDYEVLAELSIEQRERFLMAAGQVARPGPWAKRALAQAARKREEARKKARDERLLERTGMRQSRRQRIFTPWTRGAVIDRTSGVKAVLTASKPLQVSPPAQAVASEDEPQLEEPRHCYICKDKYRRVHFFYDALCPTCASFNWNKRTPRADLSQRVALVTGARVKIGFHAALMLLRNGAHVIVTTRFPRDAAKRYAAESDFQQWADRLEIFGLDLRHTPSVEAFAASMSERLDRLDYLIHNACQTVRRPVGFYDHLMTGETQALDSLDSAQQRILQGYEDMRDARRLARATKDGTTPDRPLLAAANAVGLRDPAALSQLTLLEEDLDRSTHLFPSGQLDCDQQQVDLRAINSWRLPLAEVSTVELLEVQLVNAVAPFILNARLKAVMLRSSNQDKHIVNVSAVEGQFARRLKTEKHPHTNMAKAALNMMTRTSAADYVRDGIHMNSIDTGWVTDEDPVAIAARKQREQGFHPPLDIVDGAARIVDPIFVGRNTGKHVWGAFLKDYEPTDW